MKPKVCRKRKITPHEEIHVPFVPSDVWQVIFTYGSISDLGHLEQVCKRFHDVIQKIWDNKAKLYSLQWEMEDRITLNSKTVVEILSHAEWAWKHNSWCKWNRELILKEHLEALRRACEIGSKRAKRKFASWVLSSVNDEEMKQKAWEYSGYNVADLTARCTQTKGTPQYPIVLYKYIQAVSMGENDKDGWALKKLKPLLDVDYPKALRLKWELDENFEDLLKAAQLGDISAQHYVGVCYLEGDGVPQNQEKALEWFSKAADQGSIHSMHIIGTVMSSLKRFKDAFQWNMKAAMEGHHLSQYEVSEMYAKGQGVRKNDGLSFEWMQKSAEAGNVQAMNDLAYRYTFGWGTEKDSQTAVSWYHKAADGGYALASFNLGVLYRNGEGVEKDFKKSVECFRKAAENGSCEGHCYLGEMYQDGTGVKKNIRTAITHYKKAILEDDETAYGNLGALYLDGTRVKKDVKLGMEYTLKGAQLGCARAQYLLSRAYEAGNGVPQDPAKSFHWCKLAAQSNHVGAQVRLGWMYYSGFGVRKSYRLAFEWFMKANEYSENACINLGILYQQGHGVTQDDSKSQFWFEKAKRMQKDGTRLYYFRTDKPL